MSARKETAASHVTHAGQNLFAEIGFDADESAELVMRSHALMALERWLKASGLTRAATAKVLGTTQACVSDIKRGKINQFSLDMLVRFAARAGLKPELSLSA